MTNKCESYWAFADFIPIDDVVSYWCEKSGFDADHCKSAKRAAILTYCKSGAIKYGRSDGKTFMDPPDDLAGRNLLTIERASFDLWVTENFEKESPLPERQLGTTERKTLLKLVIGMAVAGYTHDPSASKSPVPKEIADDLAKLGISVDPDTVRKYLREAAATVLPAKARPI